MSKFALIGKKLGHSYSKKIHEMLFQKYHRDASYELLECTEEDLPKVMQMLRDGKYQGINVTIPYKEKIIPYLDGLSEEAKHIGAVNTIAKKDGKLIGYNTDYQGFLSELDYYNLSVKGKKIYVLGSGGASKAVVYALQERGAIVKVVSRTPKENELSYEMFEEETQLDFIVNATPVGMYPNIDISVMEEKHTKRAECLIDLIFNPPVTKFMRGHKKAYNGFMMLVEQARFAEAIWFEEVIELNQEEYQTLGV